MRRQIYQEPLKPTNIVHHTEQGRLFLQRMVNGLKQRDSIPRLVEDSTQSGSGAITQLNTLRRRLARVFGIDAALEALNENAYFRPYLQGHAALISQVRNSVPSDSTIVYRHREGEFDVESMYSVSHDDPTGPLIVGPWLLPATSVRTERALQRYAFGLHEFAEPEELFESYVYRTIYADRKVSWLGIILARNDEFTWVLYIWFGIRTYSEICETVKRIRAGLSLIAARLAELFASSLAQQPSALRFEQSKQVGLLALSMDFRSLLRTNFAAESMLQGMTDPYEIAPRRASIYARLRLEYERRKAAGKELSWTVDNYCHPTNFYPGSTVIEPALQIHAETLTHPISGTEERLFTLRELHLPHLPSLKSWRLTEHSSTGVATTLKRLGSEYRAGTGMSELPDGYFVKSSMCVARPVWDMDLVANRIQHYYRVEATDLGRNGLKDLNFREHPMCALLYRGNIVGVLQAV